MEFGLREWMILIGGLLIVVVVIDGVRRMLADRRNVIRMNIAHRHEREEEDDFDDFNPELPNGGARAVGRYRQEHQEPDLGDGLELDALALELEFEPEPRESLRQTIRDTFRESFMREAPPVVDPSVAAPEPDSLAPPGEVVATATDGSEAPSVAKVYGPVAGSPVKDRPQVPAPPASAPPTPATAAVSPSLRAEPAPEKLADGRGRGRGKPRAGRMPSPVSGPPEEVLVINVLARDKNGFNGADLLEVLMACDVRFGEMNIFHRHEDAGGTGPVQFSVANLVKPGTFDLSSMREFYTPGISMFLQLPGPTDPRMAFECMSETAACIVKNLQGEMRDQDHSVLTPQTLGHYRERVREFSRRQLAHRSA